MRQLLCLLLVAFLCVAQGERGELNGTVTDSSGAVVPNAEVIATETQTNVQTKATTTSVGRYSMTHLPPGVYTIAVSASGFRTAIANNVTLRVAQTLTVDMGLEVGQASERVTVTSEAPGIETGAVEIGRYVSKKEFDTWPIQVDDGQRQIQQFIFSSLPGTTGDTFQGSINGGQNYSHEILIEGMALGRFDLQGGSNNEFSPSAESVGEFKLQTGTIGAQYGGGQTAIANFAIKSGTNSLHGTGAVYVQNDILRANGFVNNALGRDRPPYKLFNWVASGGGPIYIPKIYNGKNKSFFFVSYEKTRVRDFVSNSRITLPTTSFKGGDFSRLFDPAFTGNPASGSVIGTDALGRPVRYGQIYDPRTTRTVNGEVVRDPFPNNVISASQFDPVAAKILQLAPITDPITGGLLNNYPTIATCCPVFDQHTIGVKGDHIFNEAHRISVYYNQEFRERNNSPTGRWGIPPGTPTDVYQLQNTPGKLARISEDWTITPRMLNHFAVGYNRFGNLNYSVYVNQDWPSKIGLQNVPGTHFPILRFTGRPVFGGGIGAGGRLGSGSRSGSFNGSTIYQDDFTYIHGAHNFRAGVEARFYYYNNRNLSGSGDFTFNPVQTALPGFENNTGQAFASFLLGAVQKTNRDIALTNPAYRTHAPSFYFSDDWKATKKLSVNIGLRWEIIGGIFEVKGRMTDLDLTAPNPGAANLPGALQFADDLKKKTFQDTYYGQLSPRVGFAYAATSKMVIRGGYGINNSAPVTQFNAPSTFGYNGNIDINAGNTPREFVDDPVLYLRQPYPNFIGALPNKDPASANGQSFQLLAKNSAKLGYVQNFNLGVGYQFPANFVFEVNYIGNKGTRLIGNGLDNLNQMPVQYLALGDALLDPLSDHAGLARTPYAGFDGTVAQALLPYPQYQAITQYNPPLGMSTYHSLQTVLTRHFSNGLAILAAYTWSKALTDVESPLDAVTAQDVRNRSLEKSIASFSTPHSFKLTWIYELPIGPGKRVNITGVPGKILGGWQVAAIQTYRTGNPLAITTSSPTDLSSYGMSFRPDVVAGVPQVVYQGAGLDFKNGTQYLNPAAFRDLPLSDQGVPLRIGTAPRFLSTTRGPSFQNEDFGLLKRFLFTEQAYFEFRGDFINAFNRHGLDIPDTDVASPTFGRILGVANGPRSIQLSARITF